MAGTRHIIRDKSVDGKDHEVNSETEMKRLFRTLFYDAWLDINKNGEDAGQLALELYVSWYTFTDVVYNKPGEGGYIADYESFFDVVIDPL